MAVTLKMIAEEMERCARASYGMWAFDNQEEVVWRFASRPAVKKTTGFIYPSNTANGVAGAPNGDSMKDASECTLLADSIRASGHQCYYVVRKYDNTGIGDRQIARRHSGSANLLFADGHAGGFDKSNLEKYGWKGTAVN